MDPQKIRTSVRDFTLKAGLYRTIRTLDTLVFRRKEFYEELAFHRQFIQPHSLCFDVGANRGQSSEIYLKLGAKVIAYEPQEALQQELYSRCHGMGAITIVQKGVGEKSEKRTFYLRDYDQVASLHAD
jgi:hypothetical protein